MRYLKPPLPPDATVHDIEAGITELRRQQLQRDLPDITKAGLAEDIEELWDRRAIALMEPEHKSEPEREAHG